VHEAEDVVQRGLVVRIAFEAYEFDVDNVEAFSRFRKEFTEQIVHGGVPRHKKGRVLEATKPAYS